jgi:hypothetical protein
LASAANTTRKTQRSNVHKHDALASAERLRVTPWPLSTQDAAEALYDYVVQKDSLGLVDKKMVTRV